MHTKAVPLPNSIKNNRGVCSTLREKIYSRTDVFKICLKYFKVCLFSFPIHSFSLIIFQEFVFDFLVKLCYFIYKLFHKKFTVGQMYLKSVLNTSMSVYIFYSPIHSFSLTIFHIFDFFW